MDFYSILSQSRRRGHRNIPGEYPGPPNFSVRFARLRSRHWPVRNSLKNRARSAPVCIHHYIYYIDHSYSCGLVNISHQHKDCESVIFAELAVVSWRFLGYFHALNIWDGLLWEQLNPSRISLVLRTHRCFTENIWYRMRVSRMSQSTCPT